MTYLGHKSADILNDATCNARPLINALHQSIDLASSCPTTHSFNTVTQILAKLASAGYVLDFVRRCKATSSGQPLASEVRRYNCDGSAVKHLLNNRKMYLYILDAI